MKFSAYDDDTEAHEVMKALLASGKQVVVTFDGVPLNPDHVLSANEEAGTVEVAVLGPTGNLQADPNSKPEITIIHGIKKARAEKGYKKTKPVIKPSRVITEIKKGLVQITVTDKPVAIEEKKS